MNSETMLREFLDGELGQAEQEVLFSELARDAGLRHQLQDHLHMHSIVQQEVPTIAAPAAATANIFAAVGYSSPVAASPALGTRFLAGFKRIGSHGLAASIGALLMFLLMLPWGSDTEMIATDPRPGAGAVEVDMAFPWPRIAEAGVFGDAAGVVPASASGKENTFTADAGNSRAGTDQTVQTMQNSGAPNVDANSVLAQGANTSSVQPSEVTDFSESRSSPQVPASANLAPGLRENPVLRETILFGTDPETRNISVRDERDSDESFGRLEGLADVEFPGTAQSRDGRLTVELRTLLADSSPEIGLPSQVDGFTADRALAFSYELKKSMIVGIEGGRESFGQEYRTVLLDRNATVRQNPQLFWAGLLGRYELRALSPVEIVFPYIQGLAGTTEVGPLAKGIIGIRSNPQSSIALSFGVEFSHLWYDINGVQYTSSKFGWFYGASVRF